MGGRSGLREVANGVYQFAVLGAQVWLLVDEPVTLVDALAAPLWPLARLRRPCAVQAALVDGTTVPGRPDIRVVHLPGHTPGSIALHLPERGIILAGDAFERRHGRLGPPSARFTEDRAAAWASIRRLAAVDFDTLCLSHFPPLQRHAAAAVRALAAG